QLLALDGVEDADDLVAAGRGDKVAVRAELGDGDRGGVVGQVEEDGARFALPDLDGLVGAGRDHLGGVAVEGCGPDGAVVSVEVARLQDDVEGPQTDDEVAGGGRELVAFGRKGEA